MHRLPFDGVIDWPDAMKRITESGYRGATAIEAMNWEYGTLSAEAFLQEAVLAAQKLEQMRVPPVG